MKPALYTIGHSTHSDAEFLRLLQMHDVSAVADVRSHPYSRVNSQFNREQLTSLLNQAGIKYVFLGGELGARSPNNACYVNGQVSYETLAHTDSFVRGLERVREGARTHRIALMCAEKDPITCHRMVLVCHQLRHDPFEIFHIREDGHLESNDQAEARMLSVTRTPSNNLFLDHDQLIEEAYCRQAERIAWRQPAERADNGSDTFIEVESES